MNISNKPPKTRISSSRPSLLISSIATSLALALTSCDSWNTYQKEAQDTIDAIHSTGDDFSKLFMDIHDNFSYTNANGDMVTIEQKGAKYREKITGAGKGIKSEFVPNTCSKIEITIENSEWKKRVLYISANWLYKFDNDTDWRSGWENKLILTTMREIALERREMYYEKKLKRLKKLGNFSKDVSWD